jgi:hypothetical protein
MTESVLLLNPRRRRRRGMPAGLRRYWATRRRRVSNPRRRRSHHRNPRHRVRAYTERRRGRTIHVRGHYSNPRRYRRHRRNPRGDVGTLLSDYLIPAGIGAASAVVLNIGWGYLAPSLPTSVQTGIGALAAQAGLVIVAGAVLSRSMPGSSRGINAGVVGALTVVAYSALANMLQGTSFAPNMSGLHDYRRYRVGAYMPGTAATALPAPARAAVAARRMGRVGWVSPAARLAGPMGAYMTYRGPAYGGARY